MQPFSNKPTSLLSLPILHETDKQTKQSAIKRRVASAGVTAAPRSNMSPAALIIAALAMAFSVAAYHESNRKHMLHVLGDQ
ncbi:unnamed protein product [Plutella xylostella]|uniref:(diamondback moth) hypothetical protein n=1 Tax=Plutella xylostella TaxID=51655 RepID=A0A8S4G2I6_PLUXY|nr:unnamed protein product [Plutella xylostella]